MFALHKVVEGKLYALTTKSLTDENTSSDVLLDCWDSWGDTAGLFSFFKRKENQPALKHYKLTVRQAAEQVLHESTQLNISLFDAVADDAPDNELDNVFQPLHRNEDFTLPIVEAKAYGLPVGPRMLRLLAIRLKDGAYIIVGGLIKTTQTLQQCKEGIDLLKLLRRVSKFLQQQGLLDAFDLDRIVIDSDHY